MTADEDTDELYAVAPEGFTTLRTELAAAAKKRGDAAAAKSIAAARRPTTAAWVVNVLVRSEVNARDRLTELTEGLRAAHAAMDGARIRELSAAQRRLVDELARAGFTATGLSSPSSALRDDVVGTLQAAIADPDVAARLGRLAKAERWSGFGDFGSVRAVAPEAKAKPDPPVAPERSRAEVAAARRRVAAAARDVEGAEKTHAGAIDALAEQTAALAKARRRYEKLLESLAVAERELNTADAEREDAQRIATAAAECLQTAKSALAEARHPPTNALR
ncbi:MAG: hypothetical protein ACRDUX_36770 [Mycobacterium sp.]